MSEARAITNVIGNGVATVVVARWSSDLDQEALQAGLNNLRVQPQQASRAYTD
jgi:aerobic C4-dicarboxylate transport protein